jgi:RNase P subunit RPR2
MRSVAGGARSTGPVRSHHLRQASPRPEVEALGGLLLRGRRPRRPRGQGPRTGHCWWAGPTERSARHTGPTGMRNVPWTRSWLTARPPYDWLNEAVEHRIRKLFRRLSWRFSKRWRSELEQADVFHVMATTRHDAVVTRWVIDHLVHALFPGLPRQKWKRRSCGDGAHGRRIYDWARIEVRPWHRPDRRYWVLARRSASRPLRRSPRPPARRRRCAPSCGRWLAPGKQHRRREARSPAARRVAVKAAPTVALSVARPVGRLSYPRS